MQIKFKIFMHEGGFIIGAKQVIVDKLWNGMVKLAWAIAIKDF